MDTDNKVLEIVNYFDDGGMSEPSFRAGIRKIEKLILNSKLEGALWAANLVEDNSWDPSGYNAQLIRQKSRLYFT
jgi:hypothetical protein